MTARFGPARGVVPALLGILVLALSGLVGAAASVSAQNDPARSAPATDVSGSSAAALEAAIPVTIGGIDLETISFDGDSIVEGADADDPIAELEALVEAAGASISDLALASGSASDGDAFVGILGARLPGATAADLAPALTPLLLEVDDYTVISEESVAGRDVLRVGPGSGLTGDDAVYVLERDDTVWYIATDEELLSEVVSALP